MDKGKSLNDLEDKYFSKEETIERGEYEKYVNEEINKTIMDKYYTPTIAEFHIGFEYEKAIGDEFVICYFGEGVMQDSLPNITSCIQLEQIRCKYLDAEDIIECGWELSPHNHNPKFITWEKELRKFELIYCVDINKYRILEAGEEDQRESDDTIFFGEIKNKSALKQLMQILNIK
jgi:hypothetical protein